MSHDKVANCPCDYCQSIDALGLDNRKKENTSVEVPSEMYEFINVLYHSANSGKYGANSWLEPDGKNSDHKSMHASMFRHLAESSSNNRKDKDSGLDPLLHLACRALMLYTRIKKGLNK